MRPVLMKVVVSLSYLHPIFMKMIRKNANHVV